MEKKIAASFQNVNFEWGGLRVLLVFFFLIPVFPRGKAKWFH